MLFSRTAVHGIYALCFLKRQENGTPLSAPVVAASLGIPRDQASKVLQSLNNAGLVDSIRGRFGGYVVTKSLNEIPVVEVLDALNPPEEDEHLRPRTCNRNPKRMCNAHRGLQRLNERVRDALLGETLAELDGTVCHNVDASDSASNSKLVYVTQGGS